MKRRGFLGALLALPAAPLAAAVPATHVWIAAPLLTPVGEMERLMLEQAEKICNPPVIVVPTLDGDKFYALRLNSEAKVIVECQ